MNAPVCIVKTVNLSRTYGNGHQIHALDGINICVEKGEFVSVMGPSGSGKSTLLNMLGALDRPTSGQVFVNGQDLEEIKSKDQFRAHSVGFVFQLHNLIPTLSARENVEVPLIPLMNSGERRKRAEELLILVGLKDRMKSLPGQLSGGERQRVAVARALANHPPIVLADEPTGSLDTQTGQELMGLLREINRSQGTTFVVVTHDPAVARQTDRVLVMEDGKIVREDRIGSPFEEDLKMWRHSGLGKQIFEGNGEMVEKLDLTEEELESVRNVLAQANHNGEDVLAKDAG